MRFKPNISLFAILALLVSTGAHAQTDEDGRFWLNVNAKGSLPMVEGLGWALEVQPRWREEGEDRDQLLIRPAITYKVSEQGAIWLGIGRISNYPDVGDDIDENRLWQQYSHQFKPFNGINISSRTRFEQRWQDNGDDTGYRLRQGIKFSRPFNGNPNLALVVADELFINTNDTDWGARSGVDQNRLFLGGAYQVNTKLRLEIGYVNQFVNRSVNQMNHVISTNLGFSF